MSYIGSNKIGKIYLGSTAIGKAYLGAGLVFDGSSVAPVLPAGYTECNYIENTYSRGVSPYIKTGITPSSEMRIVAKIANAVDNSENYPALFGVRGANSTNRFECFAYKTYVQTFQLSGSSFGTSYRTTSSSPHTIDMSKNRLIYDGVEYPSGTTGSWTSSLVLFIGSLNNNGTAAASLPSKFYYFKIYNGETLVRDFIPAYQQSSGKYGLYDLVNNVFYTSARNGYNYSGQIKT